MDLVKRLTVAIVAMLGVLGIAFGALGATNTLNLRAGNSENITCPNALTNSNVKAKSETVVCAKSPVTTTTVPATTTTAPATTTTVPATTTTLPSGGTCTNPIASFSDPEGTANTDPSDGFQYWWINNDAWNGGHGPQTLNVCSPSSWTAISNQPNNGGAVETYPDSEYDVGGRDEPSSETISNYHAITSTFAEQYPSTGTWDAAYDLWLNNWSTEIMIWNQWAGGQSYWPNLANGSGGKALTLAGVPYHFYNNGGELMFFRDTQVTSGSVDILAAFQWLVTNGYVKGTDVPSQLEYGVEICYTGGIAESFPTTGLTFSVTP